MENKIHTLATNVLKVNPPKITIYDPTCTPIRS